MEKKIIKIVSISLGILMAISFAVRASAQTIDKEKLFEKSAACLDCHEEQARSLLGTPHQNSEAAEIKSGIIAGCIGCHDGWETHMDDPSSSLPVIPSDLAFNKQGEVCGRCHLGTHQQAMLSTDPHAKASLICTSCHTIHSNTEGKKTEHLSSQICMTCHANVARQFEMRSAHPLRTGNIRCIDCHDLSGTKDQMLAVGMDWTCQNCHSDKSGPFTFEHPVTGSHLVNGGGCIECHNPHGSNNDRLLTQSGSGACLQCHAIPAGHRTQHAGLGTQFPCADCHSEIHGSFDNRALLDPNLGTRFFPDCYQSGCHIIGE